MTGVRSRFNVQPTLTIERLKNFVAIDNLTAQVPLIEVSRSFGMRVWVAYDITRTQGTYIEVGPNGLVRTITVYPSGRKHEIINRPAYAIKGLRKGKKSHLANQKPKGVKGVPQEKSPAAPKE